MAYIILKYDDLSLETFQSFKRTADYSIANHIPCSFGLIGQSLDSHDPDYISTLISWSEQNIELWNHGYFHTEEEFSTASYEAQVYSLTTTQKLMKEHLGFVAKTFGSPHNNSTETTIKALVNTCPEIENYLFAVDASCNSSARKMLMRCNYEIKTGLPDFAYFLENYNPIKNYPYFILQGHPSYWSDAEFAAHNQIIAYLLEQGHTFITPTALSALNLPNLVDDSLGRETFDKLLSYLKDSNFSLYGAGEIARELYKYLAKNEFMPKNFVVSDSQKIHDGTLCGKPVIHLSDYCALQENKLVLALLNTLHSEVRPDLERLNIDIFPAITNEDYTHLINYVRYQLY